jgi:hypothetical protein
MFECGLMVNQSQINRIANEETMTRLSLKLLHKIQKSIIQRTDGHSNRRIEALSHKVDHCCKVVGASIQSGVDGEAEKLEGFCLTHLEATQCSTSASSVSL